MQQGSLRGILGIFFSSGGVNRWLVLFCLSAAAIAEGIGLASLLPVLSAVEGGGEDSSAASRAILGAVEAIGLPATVEVLIVLVLVGIILKSGLIILAMRQVGYAVADVSTRLRAILIDSLLRVRWRYFAQQPVGRIANAVGLEATRGGQAYLLSAQVITGMIQTAVYLLVAFLVSWKLALISLAVGGTIVLVLNTLVRSARRAGRRQTVRTSELVTQLSDGLIGIKPLKAMARHGQLAAFLDKKIESLRKALRKQVISREVLRNLQEPLLAICLVAGFYVAFTRWSIPITHLLVMGLLLERTVTTMGKMQQQLQRAVVVESAYWSVQDLIEEAEAQREPNAGTETPTLHEGCRLENVSFAFGNNQVLRDVSVEIPAGRMTVITGSSGAGKTTLTDILLGLYKPDSGRVLIDDVPLDRIDLAKWRSMIGYVPQELFLFHDTVLANVTLGDPTIDVEKVEEALEAAGALDFVRELPSGIDTVVGERGTMLSGGQRQRIALARALVHDPQLLILDEVTSALDPVTEQEICNNVRSLAGRFTTVVITHRPAWVDMADRVYHLGPRELRLVSGGIPQTRAV